MLNKNHLCKTRIRQFWNTKIILIHYLTRQMEIKDTENGWKFPYWLLFHFYFAHDLHFYPIFCRGNCADCLIRFISDFLLPVGGSTQHSIYIYFSISATKAPFIQQDTLIIIQSSKECRRRLFHTNGQPSKKSAYRILRKTVLGLVLSVARRDETTMSSKTSFY